MNRPDWFDLIALVGLGCIVAAFYLWLGLPAALGLAGLALVVMGVLGSVTRARR